MNKVTLNLPKTLYRNLEIQAENEGIPLTQYIVYVLIRQTEGEYTVRVVPEQDVIRQKEAFESLLKKWGKASPSEIDEILDRRESVQPETELSSEVIANLKRRIAAAKEKNP